MGRGRCLSLSPTRLRAGPVFPAEEGYSVTKVETIICALDNIAVASDSKVPTISPPVGPAPICPVVANEEILPRFGLGCSFSPGRVEIIEVDVPPRANV